MTTTTLTSNLGTVQYTTSGISSSVINTSSWINSNTTFTSSGNNKAVMTIPYTGDEVVIEPDAALNVKGKVIINGVDLEERLERIETLLNIPIRDMEMENEFPKLKTLWKEYSEELEKYKTWKRLNR